MVEMSWDVSMRGTVTGLGAQQGKDMNHEMKTVFPGVLEPASILIKGPDLSLCLLGHGSWQRVAWI